MPAIKNTKKPLVERLSLKQESVKDKSLLERIGMNPTSSTELYNKLVKADPCWHKVDNLYFSSCPPKLYFCKNKKLLHIKKYKELLEPTVRLANSKAGIKPTAPLSVFDKENLIEFPLDFLYYLYNYYMVCALFSHTYHVTHHVTSCDLML